MLVTVGFRVILVADRPFLLNPNFDWTVLDVGDGMITLLWKFISIIVCPTSGSERSCMAWVSTTHVNYTYEDIAV